MSRRRATYLRSLLPLSLAAIALTGCGGDKPVAPAPQPVAASTPAEAPPPPPAPTPAVSSPAQTPPVARANTVSAPEPPARSGSSVPAAAPPPPPPDANAKQQQQPDALQWLQESEARKADYQKHLTEAEAAVTTANLAVTEWQRNILAIKNPYLAPPKFSTEDKQTVTGMDGIQRVQWANGRLTELTAARDAAQKALDDLKANPPVN